jgi:hypothetical protein
MNVSDQLHAPAALPPGKEPLVPKIKQNEQNLQPAQPGVKPLIRVTHCATAAPVSDDTSYNHLETVMVDSEVLPWRLASCMSIT